MSSESAASMAGELRELRERIHLLQGRRNREGTYPLLPCFSSLLPHGLRAGAAYSLEAPLSVAMALLAGPSAEGQWCGVAGVPEFGAEAAAGFGVSLDRLVLVPELGERWLVTLSALADVLPLLLLRAPGRVSGGEVSRLASRLRERGCTLLVMGAWPQSEGVLSVEASRWEGLGDGYGHLRSHLVDLTYSHRGRTRSAVVDLASVQPDAGQAGQVGQAGQAAP